MPSVLRVVASRALRAIGIEIRKRHEPLHFLARINARTVLDIGANAGQFAMRARKIFPDAFIYSFEPIPEVFKRLARLRERDARFEAINQGLGAESGEVDFEENKFTGSSSMRGITKAGLEAFPFTSQTQKIRIAMHTLDSWSAGKDLQTPMIVKMDVQGFEDQVILGGERTIRSCQAVISEVSFVPLYEGQPLFEQIHKQMSELGFRFAGMIDNANDPRTGEILQADAIFIARGL